MHTTASSSVLHQKRPSAKDNFLEKLKKSRDTQGRSPAQLSPATIAAIPPIPAVQLNATAPPAGAQVTAAAPTSKDLPSGSLVQRIKSMLKEYGPIAIGVYAALWIVPFGGLFQVFYAFDNFGHNPISLLEYMGAKDYIYGVLQLPQDARPEGWQISGVYAYLGAELLEPLRLPLSIWLAPRAKRWLSARRQPAEKPTTTLS